MEEIGPVTALLGFLATTLLSVVGLLTVTTSGCVGKASGDKSTNRKTELNKTSNGKLVIGVELEGAEAENERGFIGTAYEANMSWTWPRRVVAKEFYTKAVDDVDFTAQYWAEYRTKMMKLEHIGLARIREIYWPQKPDRPALVVVYEMVGKRQSINAYLRKQTSKGLEVPSEFKYGVLAQVANALCYLHSERVCNPFIGGRNVIIDEEGNGESALSIPHEQTKGNLPMVKVTDYAFAWVLKQRMKVQFLDAKFPELPVRWMSPATIRNSDFDKQSDVWSFGVLCWEVMNGGQRPFGQMTNEQVTQSVGLCGGVVEVKAVQHNERMKELIYNRCFVSIKRSFRPTMRSLGRTLTEFYLGNNKIPPLVMEKKQRTEASTHKGRLENLRRGLTGPMIGPPKPDHVDINANGDLKNYPLTVTGDEQNESISRTQSSADS